MELCAQNNVEYIEMPIAIDALATIIHPDNKFAECLSTDELKTMWAPEAQGKITNWNQINPKFPDAPLVLFGAGTDSGTYRSEEHTSELQSLMRISYAVLSLKQKKKPRRAQKHTQEAMKYNQ